MKFTFTLLIALFAVPCFAAWDLDGSQSALHFVTTKATHTAEVHRFKSLSGSVDAQGNATLNIDLNSVDTSIEIRDQRMQEMLFEVVNFPTATLTAKVDPKLSELAVGSVKTVDLNGTLSLHGKSVAVKSIASVERLAPKKLVVTSATPIIINAKDFALDSGVEKLREVAGLPSISYSVVVTYHLVFNEK